MRSIILAAAALLAASLAAHADPITFALNGTFSTGTLTGSVVIDTATGTVISGNAVATEGTNMFTFDSSVGNFGSSQVSSTSYNITFQPSDEHLNLFLPVGSLIGYAGGSLCSITNSCPRDTALYNVAGNSQDRALTATLTPLAATPEPSSILLLGTGMLGGAGVLKRRFA